ncbi:MAG: triose-phosphate isomerase [Bacteroidia bacterium]|nr:triose-phosphate isomerase [Bacteroidia bacterium]
MRKLLAANWKMHFYPGEIKPLLNELITHWKKAEWGAHPTVLFPPMIYLREVISYLQDTPLQVGAQNGYPGEFGAFTGEVSMAQIAACGAQWVLVGHSERRQYFSENPTLLRNKLVDAQQRGLQVIYCIGETLSQRQGGETFAVLRQQIEEVLSKDTKWNSLAVAYEPVWAIGTGINATPDQAQEAHAFIRTLLAELGAPADRLSILYGGSLKPDNAVEIFSQPDVDGGLVGGASLRAETFISIAEALWNSPD